MRRSADLHPRRCQGRTPRGKICAGLVGWPFVLDTQERGSVLIRSSDPAVPPAIQLNMLSEREDVEALVRAVQRTREIIATEPIASTVERELLPGEGADIATCIRNTAKTTSHPACSVAMGSDTDSPLDEKLRVRGVHNLRVADASALPEIPRANTQRPFDHDRRTLRGFLAPSKRITVRRLADRRSNH